MGRRHVLVAVLLCLALLTGVQAKVYERCELARQLKQLGADPKLLANWLCIAHRESSYNTNALNTNKNGSKDYGIFQINNRYWCDKGNAGCKVSCLSLQNNDISDDFRCAQQIYRETRRYKYSKGDGFNAWAAYRAKCSNGRSADYLKNCKL